MKIRWNNVLIAVLVAFIFVLAIRHGSSCRATLETVESLAPRDRVDDRFAGFIVLSVILVAVVAIVKMLTHRRRSGDDQRQDHERGN